MTTCRHCAMTYHRSADTDPGEPDWTLCPDCADLAVYGAACPDCAQVPTARLCAGLTPQDRATISQDRTTERSAER